MKGILPKKNGCNIYVVNGLRTLVKYGSYGGTEPYGTGRDAPYIGPSYG
jgi:hypothetical protein